MHTRVISGQCALYDQVPVHDVISAPYGFVVVVVRVPRSSTTATTTSSSSGSVRREEPEVIRESSALIDQRARLRTKDSVEQEERKEKEERLRDRRRVRSTGFDLVASPYYYYYYFYHHHPLLVMRYGSGGSCGVNGADDPSVRDLRKKFPVPKNQGRRGPKRGFEFGSRRSITGRSISDTNNNNNNNNSIRDESTIAGHQVDRNQIRYESRPTSAATFFDSFGIITTMMNGNLHRLGAADARHVVAMETVDCIGDLNGTPSSADPTLPSGPSPQSQAVGLRREQHQQMLVEQLNVMSLSERRLGFAASKGDTGSTSTPRITLTSVDDDDGSSSDGGHDVTRCHQLRCGEEMMIDSSGAPYGLGDDHGPLSPNFLAVPKLQEVGKERRPPVMVKSM